MTSRGEQSRSSAVKVRLTWLNVVAVAMAAALFPTTAGAQPGSSPSPDSATHPWLATWIVHPEAPGDSFGVYHFRRTFDLSARPDRFVVHVSADNRYRLLVNGAPASSGPARGDLMHWNYETVDLAAHLKAGRNTLAAVVWNYGPHRPVAQISYRTAFLVQGDGESEAVVNTGSEWKVLQNRSYAPVSVTSEDVRGYFASTPGEALDARSYPWGWEQEDFPDEAWPAARAFVFREGTDRGALPRGSHPYGEAGGWQLVPRSIPPMEETLQRIPRLRRSEGVTDGDDFLKGTGDLVVPANARAVLLLDQTYVTNAYPVLETSGGTGATLTLTYAEAAVDSEGRKGNRDEIEGKTIHGIRDRFTFDGGAHRRFSPLSFRTFRYIRLEVRTEDEPLHVHDLHGIYTAYPFEERGSFSSDLPWLERMWEINWRTARVCAWETYFDTPYYEQLQYVGDTRLQALISLYVAGDDRLMRNAITQFAYSQIPEGITASRYPSELGQFIPPYSLVWVTMLYDYWMYRDDPAYVRQYLPGSRAVLAWYERRIDGTGLLGPMPWWNYVDSPAFPRGVPPGAEDGNSAVITAQFAYTLRKAAELEAGLGEPALSSRYGALADSLGAALRAHTWDAGRGLFADTPAKAGFSQHVNAFAVLADLIPEEEQLSLMERLVADSAVIQPNFYFRFYIDEALHDVGLGDRYVDRLAPWQSMLALGLTTTPERPEPTRSDSHAWTAHPNYGLLATVLGVRPAEPGFRSVHIAPALGPLRRAEGRVAHPAGDVVVRLERDEEAGLLGEVTLPPGLTGVFEWRGRQLRLGPGPSVVDF